MCDSLLVTAVVDMELLNNAPQPGSSCEYKIICSTCITESLERKMIGKSSTMARNVPLPSVHRRI
jgi:hypothetical protein